MPLVFDRRLMLPFIRYLRRSLIRSPIANLTAPRLSALAREELNDERTGKNGCHALVGMVRQEVFGRLARYYENLNDAAHLRYGPGARCIIGGQGEA